MSSILKMLMEPRTSHSGCRCVPKNQVSTGPKYVKLNSSLHLTTISLADDHFGEAPFFSKLRFSLHDTIPILVHPCRKLLYSTNDDSHPIPMSGFYIPQLLLG